MKFTAFTSSLLQSAMPEQSKLRNFMPGFVLKSREVGTPGEIKRLFLTALFIFVSLSWASALDLLRKADSSQLVTLYNNAGGGGWINKSGWLSSYITSWYGVTTATINGSVRVTGIALPSNNLTGTLLINSLSELQVLDVHGNPLPGGSSDYSINSKLVWIDASNTGMGINCLVLF